MPSTVLVTGAAGVLGRRLVPLLHDRGHIVRALVHERPVAGADEVAHGDLLDTRSLRAAVIGVDVVLHLAARTHARSSAEYHRFNVTGTANLANAAAAEQTRRFVFLSTRAIAANGGGYSVSKMAAEAVVASSGLDYTTVRLPEVVGAGSSEGVDRMVASALAGRALFVIGEGLQQLCPVHVDDVLPALVMAVENPAAVGRTYTLAGECTTMRSFAERVVAATGGRSKIVAVPAPLIRGLAWAARLVPLPLYPDQYARLSAEKPPASPEAAIDLGFSPRPLDDAIRALAG